MNKSEVKAVLKTVQFGRLLGKDYIARALSALYRSALTTRSKMAILAVALDAVVTSNAEFII